MFPYHDENETQRTAFVTLSFIGLNVLAWVVVQGAGAALPLAESVCNLGLIPGELTGTLPPGTGLPMGDGLVCVSDPGLTYLECGDLDVPPWLLDAPAREHVVPVALRQQHRRLR